MTALTPRLLERMSVDPPAALGDLRVRKAGEGDYHLVRGFIAEFHSILPNPPHGWRLAFLIFDEYANVWGVATWGRPSARAEAQWSTLELTRYTLADGLPRNTATYCLARMREVIRRDLPEVDRLISYQDADAHVGTIYKADNWHLIYADQQHSHSWGNREGRLANERRRRSKWERHP